MHEAMTMSLEIRPLAALYPPPINIFRTDTIERGANAVGMIIPPPAITEVEDRERSLKSQPCKALFCMGGGPGGITLPGV